MTFSIIDSEGRLFSREMVLDDVTLEKEINDLIQDKLSPISINFSNQNGLKDKHLNALIPIVKNLVCLTISNCVEITDNALVSLFQKCINLTYIDISGCKKVTNTAILALEKYCKNLRRVDISDCDNIPLSTIDKLWDDHPELKIRISRDTWHKLQPHISHSSIDFCGL